MTKTTEGIDVGDTSSVKKFKSKVEREQQRCDEDIRVAVSTYQGRSLLWSQLEQAGIYHTTFNADHAIMSFNEGMRQIGLLLLKRIDEVDPNAYAKMRREASRREEDK